MLIANNIEISTLWHVLRHGLQGISFSDMMYVTKKNMKTAVASMTKHLEDVKSAVAVSLSHIFVSLK